MALRDGGRIQIEGIGRRCEFQRRAEIGAVEAVFNKRRRRTDYLVTGVGKGPKSDIESPSGAAGHQKMTPFQSHALFRGYIFRYGLPDSRKAGIGHVAVNQRFYPGGFFHQYFLEPFRWRNTGVSDGKVTNLVVSVQSLESGALFEHFTDKRRILHHFGNGGGYGHNIPL